MLARDKVETRIIPNNASFLSLLLKVQLHLIILIRPDSDKNSIFVDHNQPVVAHGKSETKTTDYETGAAI